MLLSDADAQSAFHFDEGFGSDTLDYRIGSNATITNVTGATWITGAIGSGALSLAGSQAVTLARPISDFDQEFSIEFWIQPQASCVLPQQASVSSVQQLLFPPGVSQPGSLAVSVCTNGVGVYSCTSQSCTSALLWSGALSSTSWSAIALVVDQNQPRLYV
jgi:hypothetical protein